MGSGSVLTALLLGCFTWTCVLTVSSLEGEAEHLSDCVSVCSRWYKTIPASCTDDGQLISWGFRLTRIKNACCLCPMKTQGLVFIKAGRQAMWAISEKTVLLTYWWRRLGLIERLCIKRAGSFLQGKCVGKQWPRPVVFTSYSPSHHKWSMNTPPGLRSLEHLSLFSKKQKEKLNDHWLVLTGWRKAKWWNVTVIFFSKISSQ